MSNCNTPDRCVFIAVYANRPTAATDAVISDFQRSLQIPEPDVIDAYADMIEKTREMVTVAMACTRCGKSVPIEQE